MRPNPAQPSISRTTSLAVVEGHRQRCSGFGIFIYATISAWIFFFFFGQPKLTHPQVCGSETQGAGLSFFKQLSLHASVLLCV